MAGVNERYLREWAAHHAASNYLSYDPVTQKFTLPPEQAMVFAIDVAQRHGSAASPINLQLGTLLFAVDPAHSKCAGDTSATPLQPDPYRSQARRLPQLAGDYSITE